MPANPRVDFALTAKELDRYCRGFSTIDPAAASLVLFDPDREHFPRKKVLARYLKFWKATFVEASMKGKTLAYQQVA